MNDDTEAVLRAWLERFAACVRAKDFDAARPMIAEDVVSFGTRANVVAGRENLIAQQWRHIWPTIEGFTFNLDTLHWRQSGDLAWAVLTWDSRGFRPDGTPFPRPGRATFAFARRDGRWLATHTHFSLFPTPVDAGG
jgi:ketosteroid isomerase-like protein